MESYSTIIEEEDGLQFTVIKASLNSYDDDIDSTNFALPTGLCKILLTIDKTISKTHYYKNGKETSKETILQEERIKNLRR